MMQISNLAPDSFASATITPAVPQRPRKRQRKVLSCDACHRQKVRCDRQQPCARCIAGNRADACNYQTDATNVRRQTSSTRTSPRQSAALGQPSPPNSDISRTSGSGPPKGVIKQPIATCWRKGRAMFSGLTHWAQLAFQFEEAAAFIKGDPRRLGNIVSRMKNLKHAYPPRILRGFPFGDANINPALCSQSRLSFLPSKELAEDLVENYFKTWEVTHPLLVVEEFQRELYEFWITPEQASDTWLAQLYVMLALSCYSSSEIRFNSIPGGHVALAKQCMDGAELAFAAHGHYMSKPSLLSTRVLALIALAKRIDIVTGEDLNGQWVFMGFVTRIAMSLSLHINSDAFDRMPRQDAKARKRLWNTLLILDTAIALDAGMPLMLRPEDYDQSSLSSEPSSNNSNIAPITGTTAYQDILAQALPILSFCLNKVNSPDPTLTDEQITTHDCKIATLLCRAQTLLPFQRNIVEIFIRRCLCSLHQARASDSSHPLAALSTKTIQDAAISMFKIQQSLVERPSTRWLADFFARDFGVVGLHVAMGLRAGTFDPASAKAVAWQALRGNHGYFRDNVLRSRHYFKIFKGFSVLTRCLEVLETPASSEASMQEAVWQAGVDMITTVEQAVVTRESTASLGAAYAIMADGDVYGSAPLGMNVGNGGMMMTPGDSFDDITLNFEGVNFEFDDLVADFFYV